MSGSVNIAILEVPVEDAWAKLQRDPGTVLVDVRTNAEWAFVGVPDLSAIGKEAILIEWQDFPDGRINPRFVEQLQVALSQAGKDQSAELLFICRSGGRSLMAARAMTAAGFTHCCNVSGGFEGGLDPDRHRGRTGGWKASDLPWVQG